MSNETDNTNVEEINKLKQEYDDLNFQINELLAKRNVVREKLVNYRQWKYL